MTAQRSHEMQGIEPFCQYLVEREQGGLVISRQEIVNERERILIVEHIEVLDHILIMHIPPAECHCLVEYRQSVPHGPVRLAGNDMKRLVIYRDALLGGYAAQVPDNVVHSDPVEIVCLAAGQDRRKDLVLLRGGKNEYRIGRRFLQCLEEGVESRRTEHVHLIYDIDAVLAYLRRYAHLVYKGLDVIHTVV